MVARQAGEDLSRLVGDPRTAMRRRTPADAPLARLEGDKLEALDGKVSLDENGKVVAEAASE